MKNTLEKNITSPHVVARGKAILDEMPNIIEGVKDSSLIPEGKKSIKKFVLNEIKEDPELVFYNKYALNIIDLAKKTETYDSLNSRYKEVLMDDFGIGRDDRSIEECLDYVEKELYFMKNPHGGNK
jgi:hypothetical protein